METILSGMKPSGYLHFGNYVGALKNWVELQKKYQCYYMVADIHAMTSNQSTYRDVTQDYIKNMVIDWLAMGIDPDKSVVFVQSDVPEHTELFSILSMLTPVSWLERNPTFKEIKSELKGKNLDNVGFLAYPVLQAADITLYGADKVPVGKDQLPHLEITREIVRRFHHLFNADVFKEPEPILSKVTKLMGLDGRKMSKSYNNTIYLKDDDETLRKKVMSMVTDVKRIKRSDPGHPDECNLFLYYKAFSKDETFIEKVRKECVSATIGCVDDKKRLFGLLQEYFADFREKRAKLVEKPEYIEEVLREGARKARAKAKETMEKVREAIGWTSNRRYD